MAYTISSPDTESRIAHWFGSDLTDATRGEIYGVADVGAAEQFLAEASGMADAEIRAMLVNLDTEMRRAVTHLYRRIMGQSLATIDLVILSLQSMLRERTSVTHGSSPLNA